ncbi:hypothetical protein PSACC_02214 [Paramicrosporidium saccamoebae]|uniref:Uncharacterized protein n=1 Tax=Paramicrosporidium saccamoebae TaxID=1246581 RepID=A0A2H9TJH6_9FUNG|nr:hypothetical protein PSACC_02214 [Paramicrosporidium saccamoebae]
MWCLSAALSLLLFSIELAALQISIRVVRFTLREVSFGYLITLLDFDNSQTYQSLEGLFRIPGAEHLQGTYADTVFPNAIARKIYDRYIDEPTLHRLMLPVQFFLSNTSLEPLIFADWHRYRPTAFDCWDSEDIIQRDPWRRLVLETIAERPNMAGKGDSSHLAYTLGIAKAWELYRRQRTQSVWDNIDSWQEERPFTLVLIQVATGDVRKNAPWKQQMLDWLTTKRQLCEKGATVPRENRELLEFLLLENGAEKYYNVLQRLPEMLHQEPPARLCLWHGKLLHVALNNAASTINAAEFLETVAAQYFLQYNTEDYSFPLISSILNSIGKLGLDLESDSGVAVKLTALQAIHHHLPPLWGNRDTMVAYWRVRVESFGSIDWNNNVLSWHSIVGELNSIYYEENLSVMNAAFETTLKLRDVDENLIECRDVYCFLRYVPAVMLNKTNGFSMTSDGFELVDGESLAEDFWNAIGRIIVIGMFYAGHDVFRLSKSTWDRIYTPEGMISHTSIHSVLDWAGMLKCRGKNRIQ